MNQDDPGWKPAFRQIRPTALVPQMALRRARKDRQHPTLIVLRTLFLTVTFESAVIGVILWFLGARPSPHGERFAYLVAGYFCVAVAAMSLINRQAPPGSEPEKVAGWYRGRSFIKLGLLEAIVLFGFVGVFISGRYWMYLLGFGLALLVWPLAAPTSTSIQRDQQSLIAHGNPVDLLQVLTQPPSAPSD